MRRFSGDFCHEGCNHPRKSAHSVNPKVRNYSPEPLFLCLRCDDTTRPSVFAASHGDNPLPHERDEMPKVTSFDEFITPVVKPKVQIPRLTERDEIPQLFKREEIPQLFKRDEIQQPSERGSPPQTQRRAENQQASKFCSPCGVDPSPSVTCFLFNATCSELVWPRLSQTRSCGLLEAKL